METIEQNTTQKKEIEVFAYRCYLQTEEVRETLRFKLTEEDVKIINTHREENPDETDNDFLLWLEYNFDGECWDVDCLSGYYDREIGRAHV